GDDRLLVRSQFTKGGGGTVAFDYMLMRVDGQWRVVNILTDGISDLALKRSQYGALYAKGGMAAVLASIDGQIKRLHEH
ncbi:MAG: transporter, partial [Betaproteobacteria bacterium HGW-Betaproteobacteria-17]